MAFEPITAAHRIEFRENVALALQQRESRFENAFTYHANLRGRQAQMVTLVGPTEARVDAATSGPTPNIAPRVEPVFCRPRRLDWGRLVEKEDTIKSAIDFTSTYVQEGASAIARGRDLVYRDALFGPRLVGQDGTQSEAYTSQAGFNLVPIDFTDTGAPVNSGMTIDKLVQARSLLARNMVDVDNEQLFCVISSRQETNLFRLLNYISGDFNNRKPLTDGRLAPLLSINFIRYEGLPTVAGQPTHRRCFLWAKSGMHWGDFSPLETMLERDTSFQYRLRPYMETWIGATRSEDGKVIEIRCLE